MNPNVKTFLKAADYGSFSSAADQLYISKVSVMNQINALEARWENLEGESLLLVKRCTPGQTANSGKQFVIDKEIVL